MAPAPHAPAPLQAPARGLRGRVSSLGLVAATSLACSLGATAWSVMAPMTHPGVHRAPLGGGLSQGSSGLHITPLGGGLPQGSSSDHGATARRAGRAGVLSPPFTPALEERQRRESSFVECEVSACYRCNRGIEQGEFSLQAWLFREAYISEFDVFLRKLGYHLPMIYQNVSIVCEEKPLGAMTQEKCFDCVRHLTGDAYGELGMIIPAHPDSSQRGRRDGDALEALACLTQGKAFPQNAGLFCRSRED